ncbi:hypothetical protein HK101_004959, partial [Irineochytrium annulatum]
KRAAEDLDAKYKSFKVAPNIGTGLTALRYKWSKNDVAVWDNVSAYHSATAADTMAEHRVGRTNFVVGESLYFDPSSQSRREALGSEPTPWAKALVSKA